MEEILNIKLMSFYAPKSEAGKNWYFFAKEMKFETGKMYILRFWGRTKIAYIYNISQEKIKKLTDDALVNLYKEVMSDETSFSA